MGNVEPEQAKAVDPVVALPANHDTKLTGPASLTQSFDCDFPLLRAAEPTPEIAQAQPAPPADPVTSDPYGPRRQIAEEIARIIVDALAFEATVVASLLLQGGADDLAAALETLLADIEPAEAGEAEQDAGCLFPLTSQ